MDRRLCHRRRGGRHHESGALGTSSVRAPARTPAVGAASFSQIARAVLSVDQASCAARPRADCGVGLTPFVDQPCIRQNLPATLFREYLDNPSATRGPECGDCGLVLPTYSTPTAGEAWWQRSPAFLTCPACGSPTIGVRVFDANVRKVLQLLDPDLSKAVEGRRLSGLEALVSKGFRPGEMSLSGWLRESMDRGGMPR